MKELLLTDSLEYAAVVPVFQHKGAEELTVYLCTPGGEFAAWAGIVDLLSDLREQGNLVTVAVGEVCSGGIPILAAGSPGRRGVFRHAMLGLHEPFLGETTADPAVQSAEVRCLESMRQRFYNMMAEFTTHTAKWWRKQLTNQSMLWIDAKQAVRWGLADHVLG